VQACCCVCLDVSTRISIYMLTYIDIPKPPRPAQKRGRVSSVRTGWISLFGRFFYYLTIKKFVVDGKRVSGRWLKPRPLPFPCQLLLTSLRTADLLPLRASQYLYSGNCTNSWCKERVCGCLRTYSLGAGEGGPFGFKVPKSGQDLPQRKVTSDFYTHFFELFCKMPVKGRKVPVKNVRFQ